MNQTATDRPERMHRARTARGLVQPELPGTPAPSRTIQQRVQEREAHITKTISAATNDLRTLAGQLDHWNAGRRDEIHIPPEGIPGMLRSIARDVNEALTLFYGKEHLDSFERRLNGGRRRR